MKEHYTVLRETFILPLVRKGALKKQIMIHDVHQLHKRYSLLTQESRQIRTRVWEKVKKTERKKENFFGWQSYTQILISQFKIPFSVGFFPFPHIWHNNHDKAPRKQIDNHLYLWYSWTNCLKIRRPLHIWKVAMEVELSRSLISMTIMPHMTSKMTEFCQVLSDRLFTSHKREASGQHQTHNKLFGRKEADKIE